MSWGAGRTQGSPGLGRTSGLDMCCAARPLKPATVPSSVTRSPGLSPARSAARPGGRLLRAAEPFFGRWFPGALRIRSRVLRRLPGRALGFLARRFLLFGVQFLGHRQPRLCLFEEVGDPCASDRVDGPTLPRCGERFSSDLFAARWYWDTTAHWESRAKLGFLV